MMKYIISLDQGTTSSRAIVFDQNSNIVASSQKEFKQYYPQPGWVEHDPMEILSSQTEVLKEAVKKSKIKIDDIEAIGITNQRETTIVWDIETGKPIFNAIVWQCRRTADICDSIKDKSAMIQEKTGLVLDAYFSATKIKWILDNVEGARKLSDENRLLFGTVDTWLVWNLTKEKNHLTDYSNASRTMLYNIYDLCWDGEILDLLNIPSNILPCIMDSSDFYGTLRKDILGREIPIMGVAGDQQAALFGQACYKPGMVKNTYGTGCFVVMNTGETPVKSKNNLLTTIAWGLDGKITYALEGSIFMGGATIQWLRDELKIIKSAPESEALASQVESSEGVYLVPAFTGLGAPWWDMYARGTILGMSRGTGNAHIARAALEAIAYQSRDVMDAMSHDSGIELSAIKVDGGASANNLLMQFQADITGAQVVRPACVETTALGAAYLAGLKSGIFENLNSIECKIDKTFIPQMDSETMNQKHSKWIKAVKCAQSFSEKA
ncbi:MAG: glycerol kinase GlpK [Clostridia bacterium]|nr:glycerol kinase GlpK [Clostridia bacterium]